LQAVKAALENGHESIAKVLLDDDQAMAECAFGVNAFNNNRWEAAYATTLSRSFSSSTSNSLTARRASSSNTSNAGDRRNSNRSVNGGGPAEGWGGLAGEVLERIRTLSDATLPMLTSSPSVSSVPWSPWHHVGIEMLAPVLDCAIAANRNRVVELLLRRHVAREFRTDEQQKKQWSLDFASSRALRFETGGVEEANRYGLTLLI
jgi:hypothetical protein